LLRSHKLAGGDLEAFERRRAHILDPWLQRFFAERSALGESDRPPIAELVRRATAKMATA
jgi:hypothetical protein